MLEEKCPNASTFRLEYYRGSEGSTDDGSQTAIESSNGDFQVANKGTPLTNGRRSTSKGDAEEMTERFSLMSSPSKAAAGNSETGTNGAINETEAKRDSSSSPTFGSNKSPHRNGPKARRSRETRLENGKEERSRFRGNRERAKVANVPRDDNAENVDPGEPRRHRSLSYGRRMQKGLGRINASKMASQRDSSETRGKENGFENCNGEYKAGRNNLLCSHSSGNFRSIIGPQDVEMGFNRVSCIVEAWKMFMRCKTEINSHEVSANDISSEFENKSDKEIVELMKTKSAESQSLEEEEFWKEKRSILRWIINLEKSKKIQKKANAQSDNEQTNFSTEDDVVSEKNS